MTNNATTASNEICPNCDGLGVIPVQTRVRQYVTREMALDACDPSLEGSLYSDDEWEAQPCECQNNEQEEEK